MALVGDTPAQPVAALAVLGQVGKVLKDATEAVKVFVDAVDKAITTGDRLLPISIAERTRARLVEIKGRTSSLVGLKQVLVLDNLTAYIDYAERSRRDRPPAVAPPTDVVTEWSSTTSKLSSVLRDVREILTMVQKEASQADLFVATPAYDEFVKVLNARVTILDRLIDLPAPWAQEEISALRDTRDAYVGLIRRLDEANSALGRYITASARQSD